MKINDILVEKADGKMGVYLEDVEFTLSSIGASSQEVSATLFFIVDVRLEKVYKVGAETHYGKYYDVTWLESEDFSWKSVLDYEMDMVGGNNVEKYKADAESIMPAKKANINSKSLPLHLYHNGTENMVEDGELEFDHEAGEAQTYDYPGSDEFFESGEAAFNGMDITPWISELEFDIDTNDLTDHFYDGP